MKKRIGRFSARLFLVVLLAVCTFSGSHSQSQDPCCPRLHNSDALSLESSATLEDSLEALHLYIPSAPRDDFPVLCWVAFEVTSIEAPALDEFAFYHDAHPAYREIYENELSILHIVVTDVLAGDCSLGSHILLTLAITPIRGADITGIRRQTICVGSEVVGVISDRSVLFGGLPALSPNSYFVFGVPDCPSYLGTRRRRILDVYVRHSEQYLLLTSPGRE